MSTKVQKGLRLGKAFTYMNVFMAVFRPMNNAYQISRWKCHVDCWGQLFVKQFYQIVWAK